MGRDDLSMHLVPRYEIETVGSIVVTTYFVHAMSGIIRKVQLASDEDLIEHTPTR